MIKRYYKVIGKSLRQGNDVMNEYDSVQPAYENGPKEVNHKRRMPNSKEQTGKADKMPQDEKVATKAYVKEALKEHNEKYHHGKKPYHRHKEHR